VAIIAVLYWYWYCISSKK